MVSAAVPTVIGVADALGPALVANSHADQFKKDIFPWVESDRVSGNGIENRSA